MLRFIANLALVVVMACGGVVSVEACNGRAPAPKYKCLARPAHAPVSRPAYAPAIVVAPAPAPTACPKLYCICTRDENGVMQMRGTTPDKAAAERTAEILEANGIQAWAMEMTPVPQGGGLTLSNGEAAIAIAYNIGPGKTTAAAISKSGRAEAIAR